MKKYKNINEYISDFPKETQGLLKQMRDVIKKLVPKAEEAISYGMPTFKLNGNLVHFAAYKKHIGFYPMPASIKKFKKDIAKYKSSKGAIQFPIDKKLPLGLVSKIVKFRVKESLINKK